MNIEDEYKMLVGAYYGVRTLDEYDLKAYILNSIEIYIKEFVNANYLPNYDYKGLAEQYEELDLKTKLQDSLILLRKIDAPMELILLVKLRIKQLKENK